VEQVNNSGLIPTEFCVVIEMDPPQEKVGSLYMPSTVTDQDKLRADEGKLVAASPCAFNYSDWPKNSRKPTVGDRVVFKKYSGLLREKDGRTYRLLNDRDIVAIVDAPAETVQVRGQSLPISDFNPPPRAELQA
jgi:co-chaperonin GroES (HSP10)